MTYVVGASKVWNTNLIKKLESEISGKFLLIEKPEDLTYESMARLKPKYIFFPHWSYIIPKSVFNNFECVIFHMTDLPFGRGGSPLQNLISRGIYETKISAIKCVEKLDAGPIYLKRDLSLHGSAEEIYIRASSVVEKMIVDLIKQNLVPIDQKGKETKFRRRAPKDSKLTNVNSLLEAFDHIRMLDAHDYPKAFVTNKTLKFEFSRASLRKDKIVADVIITMKNDEK
ncbi:methionyl-tRNA formyltransferase [Pseudomonadota bacterium]